MESHRAIQDRGFDEWIELQASLPRKFKVGQPKQAQPKLERTPIHSFAELAAKLRNAWHASDLS